MTFKEYLRSRRITDTPAGDFTADARGDGRMPDINSWPELRDYLNRHVSGGTRGEVLRAARKVWSGYQAKLRRR